MASTCSSSSRADRVGHGSMSNKTDSAAYNTMVVAVESQPGGGSLLGTYDSSYAYPDAQYIEINGTEGRALIQDTVQKLTLSTTGSETHQVWQPGYFNDRARTFTNTLDHQVEDVLSALRAGEEPPIHARAGQRAVALAAASVQSFEAGVRITVNPMSSSSPRCWIVRRPRAHRA